MAAPPEPGYEPSTATVASLVDPAFDKPSESPTPAEVVDRLQTNKFSRELLEDTSYPSAGAETDRLVRETRLERLAGVTERLNEIDVAYTTIKNLRGPKVMMHDVDLLVPSPRAEAAVLRVLEEMGYKFYRFRLLAHPRKVMAKLNDDDESPIDIYPEAMWIRKLVCDGAKVVDRASDVGTPAPVPEDDLYLVATHAYSHLTINLAEILHGVDLLDSTESFDWSSLITTARRWGCEDALFVYLWLLDYHLASTGRPRVPESTLDRLSSVRINQLTGRWISDLKRPLTFPVKVPVWLGTVAASIHHVPRVARRATIRDTWKDLQSHYLSAASVVLMGET